MAKRVDSRFISLGADIAPDFDISISGKDTGTGSQLFEAIRPLIKSVIYEEDEDMSSMLTINVINQPEIKLGYGVNWNAVLDSKAFQEGNFIDLFMGYGGVRGYQGRTEIVGWLPIFPSEGIGSFQIKAYDARHRMTIGNKPNKGKLNNKKRKVAYRNMSDEMIVKKVAIKYGYASNTDATEHKKHSRVIVRAAGGKAIKKSFLPTRVQSADTTDWQFLKRLAAINRFDLWVDYNLSKRQFVINFKKRLDTGSPIYEFTYNGKDGSLIEATPEFAVDDQSTDVEVLFFDRRKRNIELTQVSDRKLAERVKLTTAKPGDLEVKKTMAKGARVRFTAFGQTIEAFSDKPFRSRGDAETFVKHWLKERERDLMILKGRVVGVETLRPRQFHIFGGMSKRADGIYRLTQVKKVMTPGSIFNCEFLAHKVISQQITVKPKSKARRKRNTVSKAGKVIT
jgi:hypothetical protein